MKRGISDEGVRRIASRVGQSRWSPEEKEAYWNRYFEISKLVRELAGEGAWLTDIFYPTLEALNHAFNDLTEVIGPNPQFGTGDPEEV